MAAGQIKILAIRVCDHKKLNASDRYEIQIRRGKFVATTGGERYSRYTAKRQVKRLVKYLNTINRNLVVGKIEDPDVDDRFEKV